MTEATPSVKPAVKKSELTKKTVKVAKPTKPAAKVADKKPADKKTEFTYGIKDLAAALGSEAVAVRGMLRRREIKKNGTQYGWNTKAELDAVVKQLKAA